MRDGGEGAGTAYGRGTAAASPFARTWAEDGAERPQMLAQFTFRCARGANAELIGPRHEKDDDVRATTPPRGRERGRPTDSARAMRLDGILTDRVGR